jgi:hypothetical protein
VLCLLGALTTPLDQNKKRDRKTSPCDQTNQRHVIHRYLLLLGLDAVSSVCNASEQRRKYREYLDCTAVVGGVSLNEAIRALAGNLAGFRGRSVKYRDACRRIHHTSKPTLPVPFAIYRDSLLTQFETAGKPNCQAMVATRRRTSWAFAERHISRNETAAANQWYSSQ